MNKEKLYNNVFVNNFGIKTIKSNVPGKTITLICCTHGDEVAGIQAFNYLLNEYKLNNKLLKGKINFVIGNKEGFLNNKKFIDIDLNRVWDFNQIKSNTYEYNRAKEILPILKESDYVLDLHSTTNPSRSMFIPNKEINRSLLYSIKTDYIILGILNFFHGKTLIDFNYKNSYSRVETMVLEGGQNNKLETLKKTIENILNILNFYGYIKKEGKLSITDKIIYKIKHCFYSKSLDVRFVYKSRPESFQKVKKGETIYIDNGEKVIAPYDSLIIMPTNPRYIGEEIGFLVDKTILTL